MIPNPKDNPPLRQLHEYVKSQFANAPEYDVFVEQMNDVSARQRIHSFISSRLSNVPDFTAFSRDIGYETVEPSVFGRLGTAFERGQEQVRSGLEIGGSALAQSPQASPALEAARVAIATGTETGQNPSAVAVEGYRRRKALNEQMEQAGGEVVPIATGRAGERAVFGGKKSGIEFVGRAAEFAATQGAQMAGNLISRAPLVGQFVVENAEVYDNAVDTAVEFLNRDKDLLSKRGGKPFTAEEIILADKDGSLAKWATAVGAPLSAVDTAADAAVLLTAGTVGTAAKVAQSALKNTLLKNGLRDLAKRLGQSVVARIGTAALTEAGTEAVQSAGEVGAGNVLAREKIAKRGGTVMPTATEGVGEAVAQGAAGGLIAGGGIRTSIETVNAFRRKSSEDDPQVAPTQPPSAPPPATTPPATMPPATMPPATMPPATMPPAQAQMSPVAMQPIQPSVSEPEQQSDEPASESEKAMERVKRINKIEQMLALDAQSMLDVGMGTLIPELRIELQNELTNLKKQEQQEQRKRVASQPPAQVVSETTQSPAPTGDSVVEGGQVEEEITLESGFVAKKIDGKDKNGNSISGYQVYNPQDPFYKITFLKNENTGEFGLGETNLSFKQAFESGVVFSAEDNSFEIDVEKAFAEILKKGIPPPKLGEQPMLPAPRTEPAPPPQAQMSPVAMQPIQPSVSEPEQQSDEPASESGEGDIEQSLNLLRKQDIRSLQTAAMEEDAVSDALNNLIIPFYSDYLQRVGNLDDKRQVNSALRNAPLINKVAYVLNKWQFKQNTYQDTSQTTVGGESYKIINERKAAGRVRQYAGYLKRLLDGKTITKDEIEDVNSQIVRRYEEYAKYEKDRVEVERRRLERERVASQPPAQVVSETTQPAAPSPDDAIISEVENETNQAQGGVNTAPDPAAPTGDSVVEGGQVEEGAVSAPKVQNYTQFASENGYPDDYDTSFQAQLLGGRGLEGKRQSNRSIKEQDQAFLEMQKRKAEGKKAYEKAILEGKVIDPDGKLTREGILKRDYDFTKKELESKIDNAESSIKTIEGLGKMAYLDNGKLKKKYQRTVDDYKERISKLKESLENLKKEYEQSIASPAPRTEPAKTPPTGDSVVEGGQVEEEIEGAVTPLAPAPPIAVGSRVKLRQSPQVFEVVEYPEPTESELENNETPVVIRNTKTGAVETVLTSDVKSIGGQPQKEASAVARATEGDARKEGGDAAGAGVATSRRQEGAPISKVEGKPTAITTGTGASYQGRYALVDLADVVNSFDPVSLLPNPNFPADKLGQGRDYSLKESKEQHLKNVSEFNPLRLIQDAVEAVVGAPIITKDGFAAGGRGRLGLILANAQNRAAYQKALDAADLSQFGISADSAARRGKVLVRVLDNSDEAQRVGVESDLSVSKSFSQREAVSAFNALPNEDKQGVNAVATAIIRQALNAAVAKVFDFINGYETAQLPTAVRIKFQRNPFFTRDDVKEGRLTDAGANKIISVLVEQFRADAKLNPKAADYLIGREDNNFGLSQKINYALGELMDLKQANPSDYAQLANDLGRALERYINFKTNPDAYKAKTESDRIDKAKRGAAMAMFEDDGGGRVLTAAQSELFDILNSGGVKTLSKFISDKAAGQDALFARPRFWNDPKSRERALRAMKKAFPNIQIDVITDAEMRALFGESAQGAVVGNRVILNESNYSADTPIHEFGHLWAAWAKQNAKPLYDRLSELVVNTPYFEDAKRLYADEPLRVQIEEAIAYAIGDKGAAIVNQTLRERFLGFMRRLFERVKEALKLKTKKGQAVENMTFEDLIAQVTGDILEGKAKLGFVEAVTKGGLNNESLYKLALSDFKSDAMLYNLLRKYKADAKERLDPNLYRVTEELEKVLETRFGDIVQKFFDAKVVLPIKKIRSELRLITAESEANARAIVRSAGVTYKADVDAYTDEDIKKIKNPIENSLTKKRIEVGKRWQKWLSTLNYRPAVKYWVFRGMFERISKDASASPIGFSQSALDLTIQRFQTANNPEQFNFSREYARSVVEDLLNNSTETIDVSIPNGLSGVWVKVPKGSESDDIAASKDRLAAVSQNTNWCTARANVSGTGATKVLEEDDHDFYAFLPYDQDGNLSTDPLLGVVPVKSGEEGQLETNPYYTGIFSRLNASDNSYPLELQSALATLAKKTTNSEVVSTLSELGVVALTKEELAQKKRAQYKEKYEFLEKFADKSDFRSDLDGLQEAFGIRVIQNGDEYRLHEFTEGMIESVPDEIREVFFTKLFNTITIIEESASFANSKIKTLGNVEEIGGSANFKYSDIEDLGKLRKIGGAAAFASSKIKTLGNVEEIVGYGSFEGSDVEDLGKLKRIGGSAYFENSGIKTLGNVEEISGSANFENSDIEDLGKLRRIGGSATFTYSKIKTLGNVEEIVGYGSFMYSDVEDLGKLRKIGGEAAFASSKIKTLGNVEEIVGSADFENSDIEDLGKLRRIGGAATFTNSKIKTLGNVEEIDGYGSFQGSDVEDLGKLRRIGGWAYFTNSKIKTLGNLEEIDGSADFRYSDIKDLGKLRRIGGYTANNLLDTDKLDALVRAGQVADGTDGTGTGTGTGGVDGEVRLARLRGTGGMSEAEYEAARAQIGRFGLNLRLKMGSATFSTLLKDFYLPQSLAFASIGKGDAAVTDRLQLTPAVIADYTTNGVTVGGKVFKLDQAKAQEWAGRSATEVLIESMRRYVDVVNELSGAGYAPFEQVIRETGYVDADARALNAVSRKLELGGRGATAREQKMLDAMRATYKAYQSAIVKAGLLEEKDFDQFGDKYYNHVFIQPQLLISSPAERDAFTRVLAERLSESIVIRNGQATRIKAFSESDMRSIIQRETGTPPPAAMTEVALRVAVAEIMMGEYLTAAMENGRFPDDGATVDFLQRVNPTLNRAAIIEGLKKQTNILNSVKSIGIDPSFQERELNLPFYDYNPIRAMQRYTDGVAREIGNTLAFGKPLVFNEADPAQDLAELRFSGLVILAEHIQKAGAFSDFVRDALKAQVGVDVSENNNSINRAFRYIKDYTYSVLGSPESTVSNVAGGLSGVFLMGGSPDLVVKAAIAAARQTVQLAQNNLAERRIDLGIDTPIGLAMRAGETEQVQREYRRKRMRGDTFKDKWRFYSGERALSPRASVGERAMSSLARPLRATLNLLADASNLAGFGFVETYIRAVAAETGRLMVNKYMKMLNGRDVKAQQRAQAALTQMGIDTVSNGATFSLSDTDAAFVKAAQYILRGQPQQPSKAPLYYPAAANSANPIIRGAYMFSAPFYTIINALAFNYRNLIENRSVKLTDQVVYQAAKQFGDRFGKTKQGKENLRNLMLNFHFGIQTAAFAVASGFATQLSVAATRALATDFFGGEQPDDEKDLLVSIIDAFLNGIGVQQRVETQVASNILTALDEDKTGYERLQAGQRLSQGVAIAGTATIGGSIAKAISKAAKDENELLLPLYLINELPPVSRARRTFGFTEE